MEAVSAASACRAAARLETRRQQSPHFVKACGTEAHAYVPESPAREGELDHLRLENAELLFRLSAAEERLRAAGVSIGDDSMPFARFTQRAGSCAICLNGFPPWFDLHMGATWVQRVLHRSGG